MQINTWSSSFVSPVPFQGQRLPILVSVNVCFIDFTQILVTLVCTAGTYTYYSKSKAKKKTGTSRYFHNLPRIPDH